MSEAKKKPRGRVAKPERGFARNVGAVNERVYRKVQDAVIEHDKVATEYERRWGVDRLPELVPPELRERFLLQCDRLNEAIATNDADEVRRLVPVSCRAYAALEKAAREAGHAELTGETWEAAMPDGGVLCVTRNVHEASKVSRERPGAIVWSVEEVANVIGSYEAAKAVTLAKKAFPGATVEEREDRAPTHEELDDEIPF
jgi:hypothetical protein